MVEPEAADVELAGLAFRLLGDAPFGNGHAVAAPDLFVDFVFRHACIPACAG